METGHDIRFSFIIIFLTFILVVFSNIPALAHKVMIFAWIEGDTIFTESKFSGGKKAINTQVLVFDREGNQLVEGKTDEKGKFSFKIPKITDLRIVLNAAMGHRAEWTVPVSEIREAGSIKENKSAAEPSRPMAAGLTKEEIKKLIDDSLDKKLGPIIRIMTESQTKGPSVTEIAGGIGYIFGLMGIALFFMNRGKKRCLENQDD